MNKIAVLEGLLFFVGDEGLTLTQIKDILEIEDEEAKDIVLELKEYYENDNRGIRISFLANTFKLTTRGEHKEYYKKLIENPETNTLTQAALETLAIVAYNEPLTISQIDDIRGVGSRDMVRRLCAKGFVKEVGKSDSAGRPTMYATTSEFLDYFGLSSKDELPKFEKLVQDIVEDSDLYESKYKDESSDISE